MAQPHAVEDESAVIDMQVSRPAGKARPCSMILVRNAMQKVSAKSDLAKPIRYAIKRLLRA